VPQRLHRQLRLALVHLLQCNEWLLCCGQLLGHKRHLLLLACVHLGC
jgi:hypothetical protein